MLKSPAMSMNLSISPFSSVKFYFIHFEVLLFDEWILLTSWNSPALFSGNNLIFKKLVYYLLLIFTSIWDMYVITFIVVKIERDWPSLYN